MFQSIPDALAVLSTSKLTFKGIPALQKKNEQHWVTHLPLESSQDESQTTFTTFVRSNYPGLILGMGRFGF